MEWIYILQILRRQISYQIFGDHIVLQLQFARLFAKLPRPGNNEVTFSIFESSTAAFYYQFNHSTVKTISLSALPKNTTRENLPAFLHTIPL